VQSLRVSSDSARGKVTSPSTMDTAGHPQLPVGSKLTLKLQPRMDTAGGWFESYPQQMALGQA
jgi:hypothetical protein